MKKVSIKTTLITLAMFTSMLASCGDTTNSNSDKETVTTPVTVKSSTAEVSSPTETNEDSSSVADSSEYETTTTKTSLDDSSDSEKTETTTKAVTDNSDKETKETTSAKQTTAQPKATTTTKAVVTTTTARATQSTAKPVVTTKATTKATAKQTTKATTKATQPVNALAGLPDYKQALGRCILNTWTQADLEIIRKHYLDYGQKLAPRYKQDKTLTFYIDPKTGKGTNDWQACFNRQNPPFAPITCQEPLPIAFGYNGLGGGNICESIEWFDITIKRIVSQGLNYYNWKTADSSWELAWYIQFGYINGGKELNLLCISVAR